MPKIKYYKIACLGGGNAMPQAVLSGLKKYPVKLSAISSMLDSGGSAGKLRKSFQTGVSFGDIRRAILALSEAPQAVKASFSQRDSMGHVLANVFCTAVTVATGSPETAIAKLKARLAFPARHQALPATLSDVELCAELKSGEVINTETKIDVPEARKRPPIKRVYLSAQATAYPPALSAIKNTDLIVIGPGDLYSSLAQILLVQGMAQAIRASRAKKVYVANAMTKHGETNGFSVLDLANEIEKYLGQKLDYVVYNKVLAAQDRIEATKKGNPNLVAAVRVDENLPSEKFIGENLLPDSGLVIYDPQKLAQILLNLCKR
ncbi:MAG: hypothetical protein A2896_00045 [Candidatus Nealsonbacteria bacterium RIFCSPLOWO2_01_FULL_43_32]|uniref:Gluconeogenesis factor n=1 Tax=Candidatus Nealsonbacteria bacterium RIFCSPLOWO2_01_FULL_43_32 TaxID=1801672 RepID=A0A1G2EEL3_9BACT|nr:MAG: hypothetical protein A2896_00045 [Candidatus Nealsonbacteria bacterium RIFCSPLOWO2_01_FULL_43_32]